MRVPTSVILQELLRDPPDDVTLEWIIANLRERSFGIVMLLIALVGLVPGISPLVGLMLAIPAIQMMRGHREPVLPQRLATRRLSKARLARILARVIPVLRGMERLVRPRWATPFETTKRLVGFVILLLGGTLLAPVPFSHIVPVLVIMMLAFAFLEEDGVLLCIALAAAVISLAITAAAIWGPWKSPRSGRLEPAVAGEARKRQGSDYRLQSQAFGPRPKGLSKSSAKVEMAPLSAWCGAR